MNQNRRNIAMLLILLALVFDVIGGSLAYWTWFSEQNKSVVFNTAGNVSDYIVYDEGLSYFIGDFQPTDSYCESVNTTVSFYKTTDAEDIPLRATINMDVNSIGENIAASSDVYWVVTKGDNSIACSEGLSADIVLGSGTFYGKTAGETIKLASNIEVTTTEQKYTVWIWINSNGTDLGKLSGEIVDTNVWTQIDMVDQDYENDIENSDGYTVIYNVNGGTNGPVNQDKVLGETVTISSTVPTRTGYTFSEWNTNADGSGTSYSAGTSYSTDADLILYAVWTPNTYTISYDANGGSGTTSSTTCTYGKSCTLTRNTFTREGYTFVGWTDSSSGTEVVYKDGYTFSIYNQTSNMTLYALWEINTYTISYDANYGTGAPSSQTKTYGTSLTLSEEVPTREKHNFIEWNTASDGSGTSYQPGDTYSVESGVILYAIWKVRNLEEFSGGSVTITGTAMYGEILTASVTNTNPVATYSYEWFANSTNSTSGGTSIGTGNTIQVFSNAFEKYVYVIVTAEKEGYVTKTFSDITDASTNTNSTVVKRNITVTAGTSSKTYDGTALTNSSCTGNALLSDHTVTCTMTSASTITNAGSISNTIDTVVIKDSSGNNVTSNYNITKVVGTLTVNKATLSGGSVSISGTLTYGETLTATVTDTAPAATYTYQWYTNTTSSNSGGTAISGETSNTLTLWSTSFDKYVYVVVTATKDNYNSKTFTSAATASKVGQRNLTVTADSNSKTYDGSALTDSGCTLTSGSFVSTHYLDACTMTSTSTITNVGSVNNVISTATIKNGSGTNVGTYYNVTKVNGTLTVNKADATCPTLTAYSGTYDGSSHTITVSGGSGGTIQYSTDNSTWGTTKPTRTNAGTTTVYARVLGDSNHNTVTCGSKAITVSAKAVTVTAKAQTIECGGSISTGTSYATLASQVSGHTLTAVTLKGSRTTVGTGTITPSAATISSGSTAVTSNYSVSYKTGTLTVVDTTAPTVSSVTLSKSSATITATVTASDSCSNISTYYYYLSTSTTCPSVGSSSYKSSSNASYSFTVSSSGTYYACAYASDSAGNTPSSAIVSSSTTISSSSKSLTASNVKIETKKGNASTSFTTYQSSITLSTTILGVLIGGDGTYYHVAQMSITFPSTTTKATIKYYTNTAGLSVTIRRKVLASTNTNYYYNYPTSSYASKYDGTHTHSGTAYASNSFTISPPEGSSVFEANKTYYIYLWTTGNGAFMRYSTASDGYGMTITYTYLS